MDNHEIYAIVQLGIIGGAVALLIIGASIAGPFFARYWYLSRRAEMEATLKQAMIERGMTAQQICAVIESSEGRKTILPSIPDPAELANECKDWANNWKDWAQRWKARKKA
jgi:hypothetical protein